MGKNPAGRLCPYTGELITLEKLHSDEVQIDHILLFERTFDDSPANKTVCFRSANHFKCKSTTAEVWFDAELDAIVARTKRLPDNKAWPFRTGAMER